MIIRTLLTCAIAALHPLWQTRPSDDNEENAKHFIPIPATSECIESVEMVLHIPIAVDYFYAYL
jgi:hypothetical protein